MTETFFLGMSSASWMMLGILMIFFIPLVYMCCTVKSEPLRIVRYVPKYSKTRHILEDRDYYNAKPPKSQQELLKDFDSMMDKLYPKLSETDE